MWITAALVFVRMNALLLTLPVFSTTGVPKYVGFMLSVALTFLIAPGVPLVEGPITLKLIFLGIAGELLVGMSLGMVIRAVYASLLVAAELASRQTGMGMASSLDPVMNVGQSPMGILASWLAGLVFIGSGLHLRIVVLIAESFHHIPPGTMIDIKPVAAAIVDAAEIALVVGFQLSGPLIALVFLVNVFIGLLSRLAPKMNVFFSVGMTLNSVVGIWLFALALPWMLPVHQDVLQDAILTVSRLILEVGSG